MNNQEVLDLKIDIVTVAKEVFKARKVILLVTLILGVFVYGLLHLKTSVFESKVVFSINEPNESSGIATSENRSSEHLALVEHGFILGKINDNYTDTVLASLKSKKFTLEFIEKLNIYSELFPKLWDHKTGTWRHDVHIPSQLQIFKLFHTKHRFVNIDSTTGLLALVIKAPTAELASDWANNYLAFFNHYEQAVQIEEVSSTIDSIEQELSQTTSIELRKALARVLDGKSAIALLSKVQSNFVTRIIDPALPNWTPVSPRPKRNSMIVMIVSLFFLISLASLKSVIVQVKSISKNIDKK